MRAYKDLSKVERAFRCLKSVDLKVRPIHHRRPDRVRAHVLLCMLAYWVEWHMRQALAPLLATTTRLDTAPLRRGTREEGAGAQLSDALADLGTLTANTMQVTEGGATFGCRHELLGVIVAGNPLNNNDPASETSTCNPVDIRTGAYRRRPELKDVQSCS